jgi:hypothetical protein
MDKLSGYNIYVQVPVAHPVFHSSVGTFPHGKCYFLNFPAQVFIQFNTGIIAGKKKA